MDQTSPAADSTAKKTGNATSYKYQRLREELRSAIAAGEFAEKLPGERALGKRFKVNPKTLNKALTDLAGEGLIERRTGSGTYLKGAVPVFSRQKWLVACDPEQIGTDIARSIAERHPQLEFVTDVDVLRPSQLRQVGAAIILSRQIPDRFIFEMILRDIPVVALGCEPRTISTHAVLFDRPLAFSIAAHDLAQNGHRSLAFVERPGSKTVAETSRLSYPTRSTLKACGPEDVVTLAKEGVTAFICDTALIAASTMQELSIGNFSVPSHVSVIAVDFGSDANSVSGYYLPHSVVLEAVEQLLERRNKRTNAIWLHGRYFDGGTISSPPDAIER